MNRTATLISPRLAALQQELHGGNTTALDIFWREVAEHGTPLVEPITGEHEYVLVTFLWRDAGGVGNVVLLSPVDDPVFEDGCWDFARCRFVRLDESDVFYRSYRLRHDARFTYRLSPNDSLIPCSEVEDWTVRKATWQIDPLNPKRFVMPRSEEADDEGDSSSVVELPGAPPQPWITRRPEVPAGQVQRHRVRSEILDNERAAWVYLPAGYSREGEPYGLLLVFGDWASYMRAIPTPTILDNLLAERHIPPLVAIVIDVTIDRFRELACYAPFNEFLVRELLPWARRQFHITANPSETTVAGCSLGGAAAAFAGLSHSESFGNVLCQDGAFWVRPGYDPSAAWVLSLNEQSSPEHEPEWLAHEFAARAKVPLQLYLETGRWTGPAKPYFPGNLTATRHMRDVLQAKGYTFRYSEYAGGHEFICYRGSLADGLIALMGGSR